MHCFPTPHRAHHIPFYKYAPHHLWQPALAELCAGMLQQQTWSQPTLTTSSPKLSPDKGPAQQLCSGGSKQAPEAGTQERGEKNLSCSPAPSGQKHPESKSQKAWILVSENDYLSYQTTSWRHHCVEQDGTPCCCSADSGWDPALPHHPTFSDV